MKKFGMILTAALLLMTTLLSACGRGSIDDVQYNIAAQNNVYSMGTQSVLIEESSVISGQTHVKFKQGIAPSDIVLGEALTGKTVTKVTYNSETSITVELSGNTNAAGGEDVRGTITIKQSGLEGKGEASCIVNVRAPEIQVVSMSTSMKSVGGVTTYSLIAKLSIPAGGAFADAVTTDQVTLADDVTGELSVERSEDLLIVTVKNCNAANPPIRLSAGTTTFGKEITVKLSRGGSTTIQ